MGLRVHRRPADDELLGAKVLESRLRAFRCLILPVLPGPQKYARFVKALGSGPFYYVLLLMLKGLGPYRRIDEELSNAKD